MINIDFVVIDMRVKLKIAKPIKANFPSQVMLGINITKYNNFSLLVEHLYNLKYINTKQVYFTQSNYYIPFDTPASQCQFVIRVHPLIKQLPDTKQITTPATPKKQIKSTISQQIADQYIRKENKFQNKIKQKAAQPKVSKIPITKDDYSIENTQYIMQANKELRYGSLSQYFEDIDLTYLLQSSHANKIKEMLVGNVIRLTITDDQESSNKVLGPILVKVKDVRICYKSMDKSEILGDLPDGDVVNCHFWDILSIALFHE